MSLLLLLFGWALTHARATTLPKKHVAMCITGQLARLEPESLLRHVVAPNLHAFHFDVIYAMSASRVLFEHKFVAGQGANAPTRFVNSSSAVVLREALERVHRYVFGSAADKVPARVLEFTPALTSDTAWWGFLGLPRSTKPIWAGHQGGYNEWKILNMYHNHVKCAFEIERLEHSHDARFDYLVSAREDAFVFSNVDLARFDPHCQLIYKNCLTWSGINMRAQLIRRDALPFLKDRLRFYVETQISGVEFTTPEVWELTQANALQLARCPVHVDDWPVTAMRHRGAHLQPCFFANEICEPGPHKASCMSPRRHSQLDNVSLRACYPAANASFVGTHVCIEHPSRHRAAM